MLRQLEYENPRMAAAAKSDDPTALRVHMMDVAMRQWQAKQAENNRKKARPQNKTKHIRGWCGSSRVVVGTFTHFLILLLLIFR